MVLWGAIWGGIIGWWTMAYWDIFGLLIGALLGAFVGWTLRSAVRKEFARLMQQASQRQSAAHAAPPVSTPVAATNPFEAFDQQDPFDTALLVDAFPAPSKGPDRAPVAPIQAANHVPAQAPRVAAAVRSSAAALTPKEATAPRASKPAAAQSSIDPFAHIPVEPSLFERAVDAARDWLTGGNTVARVGAVMLFIGLAFLAKWAADNSLLPPELRLVGIALIGIGLLVQGARMSGATRAAGADASDFAGRPSRARFDYGVLLQGLGVAVLYLTIFAAFKQFALLPGGLAFGLMVAVCVLSNAIALLRSAQVLAFVGFAGAFATPVLLSDGSGNHVGLFAYYALLNTGILGLAWARAWRAVNVLGFVATFGVATLWGVLRYQPDFYSTTQPFLLAFFLMYLAIGLLYTLRHGGARKHVVDASLVFGLPIVALTLQIDLVRGIEYGAACSAVVAGALYIGLAWWLRKHPAPAARWLVQSYAAIGLLLVTLAVPLALDQRVTAAVWALEGAAIYWLSREQGRVWGRAFGVLMQAVAGLMMLHVLDTQYLEYLYGVKTAAVWPFANSNFLSAMLLATGALAISWWSRHEPLRRGVGRTVSTVQHATAIASMVLFVVGFGWAWWGLWSQLGVQMDLVLGVNRVHALRILGFVGLIWAAQWAARRYAWRGAGLVVYLVFPVVGFGVLSAISSSSWGWPEYLLWGAISVAYLVVLKRVDATPPLWYWRVVHTANVGLACLLIGRTVVEWADWGQLWSSDWYAVAGVVTVIAVLLVLCRSAWWQGVPAQWPLNRFRRDYLLYAGSGVALLVGLSVLATASFVRGNVQPLPYVPLLNPVDLTVLLGVAALALWRLRIQQASWIGAKSLWKARAGWFAIVALGFIVVNTIWLRVAHHFFDVRWSSHALSSSFVVQAGYSVLWTVLALVAMLWASRLMHRLLWQVGAGLLAITVVKMLLVDLANSGGGERIVAFIAVGALMVAIGYFAPIPTARTPHKATRATRAETRSAEGETP